MNNYNIKELEDKINKCKKISIDEVDINELDDLSEIKISKKKKGYERILEFIKNISNPYIFKIDNKIVKIEFTNNGVSAEDSITNIVSNIYRWFGYKGANFKFVPLLHFKDFIRLLNGRRRKNGR